MIVKSLNYLLTLIFYDMSHTCHLHDVLTTALTCIVALQPLP